MSLQLNFTLEESTVRIEKCIPLFGAFSCDEPSAELEEFFDEASDADFDRLFHGLDVDNMDTFLQSLILSERLGFLVQIATPVMRPFGGTSFQYSWGHYYTRWIYADSIQHLVDQAVAWAAERRESEKRKAAA